MTDYTVGDTVYKRFTTRAFATGIATTLAGTPVVSAYEDDSITQITAGITLGVDHDSVTGLNLLTIVATGANGYETGKSYDFVITTGTVDSVSVIGEVVWHFTLSAEAAAVDLANGTDGLGAIKTDTAAILVDTGTTLDAAIAVIDANVDQIETAVITNAVGADVSADIATAQADLDTITGAAGAIVDSGAATVTVLEDAIWDAVLTGSSHSDATSAGRRLRQIEEAFVHASGVVDTVTSSHEIILDTGAVDTADYYVGDRLQITEGAGAGQSRVIIAYSALRVAILDSDFITDPDGNSLYEIDAADVHVAVSDADLAEGFVAVATSTTTITLDDTIAVASADYYVGEQIVFTHGTGAGQSREITAYTDGRVVTMSPALETAVSTDTVWHIQAAVSIPEIVDEMWDEDATGHQTGGTFGQAIGDPGANAETMYDAVVTDAAGTNVAADLIAVKAETALIVADTNELQTDNVPGLIATAQSDLDTITGAAGAIVDSGAATVTVISDAVWDEDATGHQTGGTFGQAIGDPGANAETMYDAVVTDAAGTNIAVDIVAVKAETVLIVADTNELQGDWVNAGRLDTLLDAIPTTAMRGTDGAALATVLGALNDAAAADEVTTADTLVQYIKQLINILIGTPGVVTLKAAAAPASGVSLSEMIRAIYDDTNSLDGTKIPDTLSLANINAEADTALDTTIAELSQGVPATNPTMRTAVMLLYMALRNKLDVATSGTDTLEVHNNAGTRIAQKLLTDDGADYSEAKMSSGA